MSKPGEFALSGNAQAVPVVPGADLETEVVDDTAGFCALEPEWRALCERSSHNHFFQSFEWLWRAWLEVSAKRGRRLQIVVGRREGRAVVIWPLMCDGQRLRFLASDQFEYRDVIVEGGEQADRLISGAWQVVRRLPEADFVYLQGVRAGSNLARFLARHPLDGWKHEKSARIISLARYRDWDDYAARLPAKLLRDQRRQWRRLAKDGGQPLFVPVTDKREIPAAIDWLVVYKLKTLRNRGLVPRTFASPEYRSFLKGVVSDVFDSGRLLLAKLETGKVAISCVLGYRHKGEFTFHIFSYDPTWESYSPSRLAMEETIKWCFANAIERFDFMPGTEKFKQTWADDDLMVTNYILPLTRRGRMLARWYTSQAFKLGTTPLIEHLYHRFPAALRHSIGRTALRYRQYAGHWSQL